MAAQQGYHAIAFDRPGYGYSERPKKRKITPITLVYIHSFKIGEIIGFLQPSSE